MLSRGNIYKLNRLVKIRFYNCLNLIKRDPEKLSSSVYKIQFTIRKSPMKRSLQCRCVITEYHRMHVKIKRYRRVSQFINALCRIKPPCHAYFINVGAKGPNIRYDIDISRFLVCGTIIHILDRRFKLFKLGNNFGLFLQQFFVALASRLNLSFNFFQGV